MRASDPGLGLLLESFFALLRLGLALKAKLQPESNRCHPLESALPHL